LTSNNGSAYGQAGTAVQCHKRKLKTEGEPELRSGPIWSERNCSADRHRAVSIAGRNRTVPRQGQRLVPAAATSMKVCGWSCGGDTPMHLNSLTPMRISGMPRSLPDIDSGRCDWREVPYSAPPGRVNFDQHDIFVVSCRASGPNKRGQRLARRRPCTLNVRIANLRKRSTRGAQWNPGAARPLMVSSAMNGRPAYASFSIRRSRGSATRWMEWVTRFEKPSPALGR
jgi:hypothetical protein